MRPTPRNLLLAALIFAPLPALAQSPEVKSALDRITADSLKGHVAFLASDALEGRGTPSKGLDIAAEYIASRFRAAGLKPIGDDGYFQTADWKYLAPEPDSVSLAFKGKDATIQVGDNALSGGLTKALNVSAGVVKVPATDAPMLDALKPEAVAGKVVLTAFPAAAAGPQGMAAMRARFGFLSKMAQLKPALILDVDKETRTARGIRQDVGGRARVTPGAPTIKVHNAALAELYSKLPDGPIDGATVEAKAGEPKQRAAKVRNVIGLLEGSDAKLKDTYVLLTAHYDHLGITPPNAEGDIISNGANDDASGTASVVEVAAAMGFLPAAARPKRSLVFLTFYGEEHGLVGSTYYGQHPVVPLEKTVAGVNLEQVGRTDDNEGPRVSAANITGFDYSDVTRYLQDAGKLTGVEIQKHPVNSDRYFFASDNAALARVGIPAHTVSVAYAFPDYHGPDDEWEKLDYANMTKVVRMSALGLYNIANSDTAPKWDANNPRTKAYRDKRP